MLALLAEASVFIHLDPRSPTVRVPPWFKNQAQLVLQVGLNMAVPIPDLDVGEEGIKCTLSFNRRPFFCSIPWKSVFGLVREGGPGLVWPDDVPVEVAAQAQKQSGQKPADAKAGAKKSDGKASDGKTAARGRLRAVGSESPEAQSSDGEKAEESAGIAETAAESASEPKAAPFRPTPVAAVAEPAPAVESPSSETESSSESNQESNSEEKPPRPTSSPKGGTKRELPSYLRVVK
jgi:stringent starvation protein B